MALAAHYISPLQLSTGKARKRANWLQKLQAALKRFLNRTLSTLTSIYALLTLQVPDACRLRQRGGGK